jgi:hypothetical protein
LFEGFSRKDIYEIPNLIILGKTEEDRRLNCFVKQVPINLETESIKIQILRINTLCYNPKLDLQYVFKIENLFINDELEYKYNGISILAPSSNKMKKITPRDIRKDFLDFKGVFAVQNIKVNSVDIGLNQFISNLKNALNYYNATYGGLISINREKYHIFNRKEKRGGYMRINTKTTLSKVKKARFSYSSEHTLAHKKPSKRVKHLMVLDKVYYKARNETDFSEKIVLYWRYLESLFDYYQKDKYPDKEKSLFIIKRVSQILITKEYDYFYGMITVELTNILLNNYSLLGLDRNTAISEYIINQLELNFDKFKKFDKARKNLFIDKEIQKLANYKKRKEFDRSNNFYRAIIFESYEQRNFLIHNFSYFNKSVIKTSLSMDIVIQRLRRIIIESILDEQFSNLSLSQTIEKIALKGKTTLTKKETKG